MGPPEADQQWCAAAGSLAARSISGSGKAAMAFREVQVHEIREVLRLWLRGAGIRSAERLAGLDRKTVRRYVAAAQACWLDRAGGEGQLSGSATPAAGCSPRYSPGPARPATPTTGPAGHAATRPAH